MNAQQRRLIDVCAAARRDAKIAEVKAVLSGDYDGFIFPVMPDPLLSRPYVDIKCRQCGLCQIGSKYRTHLGKPLIYQCRCGNKGPVYEK